MIPRSILLWAVIFAAISSIVKIAQAALVMILAAMLTPITYANFGILYALQSAMATLSVTGLSEYAIGNLPKSPSETSRLNLFRLISGTYIVVAVLSAIIIMAAAFLVMTDKGILFAGVLAIILGGIIAFGTLQSSLQRLEGQQKSSLYSGAAIGLAGTFGILIGVFLNADINTMFGFGLIGAVVVLIILINKKHFYVVGTSFFSNFSK
jgi:O-antigen/teichoic acid export membrane protein